MAVMHISIDVPDAAKHRVFRLTSIQIDGTEVPVEPPFPVVRPGDELTLNITTSAAPAGEDPAIVYTVRIPPPAPKRKKRKRCRKGAQR